MCWGLAARRVIFYNCAALVQILRTKQELPLPQLQQRLSRIAASIIDPIGCGRSGRKCLLSCCHSVLVTTKCLILAGTARRKKNLLLGEAASALRVGWSLGRRSSMALKSRKITSRMRGERIACP